MTDAANPLLTPSTLPYALPDYAAIRPKHYLTAFHAAFKEHLAEITAITRVRSMPTFENTMIPLELAGAMLERVVHAFYTVSSADATAEIQAIDEELAPLMAAHDDAVRLDAQLYWRVKTLHEQLGQLDLDGESRYLVERHFREMTHAGAALEDEAKAQLTELNRQLSILTTTFERNLLADTNDLAVLFTSAEELDGLADGELSAAARAASERGDEGFLISLPLFTGHPYLASLTNRESRRRILEASRSRAARGNAHDNRGVLTEIASLRAERARLLGYVSHAAYVTADETAGSAEAVSDLLHRLAPAAASNARAEQAALQAIIDASEDQPFALEAPDWAFYTEKVRTAKY
ncbi:MAG: M3 family metallopeptidase, partial [Microbacterium sp.]|uniref:M3 family metallopeptidase n=1 Tax=Microbacterium sp. TaxID=51671 RepID=UPI003F97583A